MFLILAELQKAGRLQVELPNGILSLGYFKGSASPLGHATIYPWHLLQDRQLEVRQRQDGIIDFFRPGLWEDKKLKKYFNDIKVPPEQRKVSF